MKTHLFIEMFITIWHAISPGSNYLYRCKPVNGKSGELPIVLNYTGHTIRPKKSCLFPVTLPSQVFIQKKSYLKVFSTLPTPNLCKTCITHTFLTKIIMQKYFFTDLPTLFFFRPLQETNHIFFLA